MASPIDVARYLIHLANREEEEDCLSPLRLQKLLYYVQGWHLGVFGRPLFAGRIEAWKHGPVVPELYQHFKNYGPRGIDPQEGVEPASLGETERAFIRSVWSEYKQFSVSGLRDQSHSESPWLVARGSLPESASCEEEISQADMRTFFEGKAQGKQMWDTKERESGYASCDYAQADNGIHELLENDRYHRCHRDELDSPDCEITSNGLLPDTWMRRRGPVAEWIKAKFVRLRDEWKAHRGHESSTEKLVLHPAYQSIIGMGPDAVPLLLRELATTPDRWFWALRAITEEDPVPQEARGNSKAMTQAWLDWGREMGYQW